jgi:transmembrane sensor
VEGRFAQAFGQAFGGKGKDAQDTLSGRSPVELLLLADVARLSGHPAESVAPLSMLLASFGSDPRAPLAAFTLGRVLLDDLGRPREAAERFHAAYQWEQEGPLAQDALAREVEAWSRAGETAQARARAREYMRLYPAGRRLLSVRHYAELTGEAD